MPLSCSLNEWIQNNIAFNFENSNEKIFIYILSPKGWKSPQKFCLFTVFFLFSGGGGGGGGVVWIAFTSFYTCRCFNRFVLQVISDIRSRFSIYSSHVNQRTFPLEKLKRGREIHTVDQSNCHFYFALLLSGIFLEENMRTMSNVAKS